MEPAEELREALLELEEARRREATLRRVAEALLEGLRVVVTTADPGDLFPRLFEVLREPLGFEAAAVLSQGEDGALLPVACSSAQLAGTRWQPAALFGRVLAGQPAAVFDTGEVPEWADQPQELRSSARSALLFALHGGAEPALFLCTHPEPARFTRSHVGLARRFSVLATQALQKLESAARVADLQERLEAEATIAALNRQLAESERRLARARKMEALGLLAGGVAHDLNNILSGIVSLPELLLLEDDLSDDQRESIETIRDSGARAAAVVADLLTVARGVASARRALDLNDIVQSTLGSPEAGQLRASQPRVELSCDLAPELLPVRASSLHVGKAFMNLLANAFDALREESTGHVRVRTCNRYLDRPLPGHDEVRAGEYVVLSVADDGGGIAPEDLERIFEPFFARKRMGRSGTGLGLTIVYDAMQDHDGYVDVASDPTGTLFSLYFPVTRDAPEPTSAVGPWEQHRGRGERVLVVDDQEDQRRIASAMLEKLGYVVSAVASGEEAVDHVREQPPDLMLLDMIMDPGIGGRETFERVRALRPDQKALIASGYSRSDDVEAVLEQGAGGFLRKPYTLVGLACCVRQALGT